MFPEFREVGGNGLGEFAHFLDGAQLGGGRDEHRVDVVGLDGIFVGAQCLSAMLMSLSTFTALPSPALE